MRPLLTSIGTFIFGVLPASVLVVLAVAFGLSPVFGLFEPDFGVWRSLLLFLFSVPLGVMAVLGCMGLFEVVGGTLTARVAQRLLFGVIANLVGIVLFASFFSVLVASCLFVPPLVVGCIHLSHFVASSRDGHGRV